MLQGYVARYLRISDDDGDLSECKNESDSITNQRNVIDYYIEEHDDLLMHPVKEFCDDGYSGVNFKRPGFQQLLKEVRENKIYCIIIKDFSRMGRNYIEVGDYLEQIFPFFGVRVISISDQYDSDISTGGLEVGFRTLIHDLYSKDLSKKIKSVKKLYQERGAFTGGNIPFGYKVGTDRKSNYVPDPEAAEIVKRIFAKACEGKGTSIIAKELNEENIPTRAVYMRRHNMTNYALRNKKNTYWTAGQIKEILENEEYVGTHVAHKIESVRVQEIKRVEPEEYVKHENAHIPLVSKEVFEKAGQVIKKTGKRGHYVKKEDSPALMGKVKCGHCGYSMNLVTRAKTSYCICRMGNLCGSRTKMNLDELDQVVLTSLNQMMRVYVGQLEEKERKASDKLSVLSKLKDERKMLQLYVERCKSDKLLNYKKYKEGGTIEAYREKQTKLEQEHEKYSVQLTEVEKKIASLSGTEPARMLDKKTAQKYSDITELNRELVKELIDSIDVYGEGRVEINWRFRI